MPTRARRRCPRCRGLFSGKGGCPTCAKRDASYQASHADEADRFYQTPEWRRISAHFLRHHPVCSLCPAPSKVADHYPTSRRDLLAQGATHPDRWANLRPLCIEHHRTETNRLQPGGFIAHPERY